MACTELVIPGDFDEGHHGGSRLGSDRAHTVSLYRQELEVVQGRFGRWGGAISRCDAVWKPNLKVLLDRKAHRPFGSQGKPRVPVPLERVPSMSLVVRCYAGTGRIACATFHGIGMGPMTRKSVVVATGSNGVRLRCRMDGADSPGNQHLTVREDSHEKLYTS